MWMIAIDKKWDMFQSTKSEEISEFLNQSHKQQGLVDIMRINLTSRK